MEFDTVVYVFAGIASIALGMQGLWWLTGRARNVFRNVEAMSDIIHRELTPDHGDSMKDRVQSISDWILRHEARHDVEGRKKDEG